MISVCCSAAGEICPSYLIPALPTHWDVDDPAKAIGTEEEINAAFTQTYHSLRKDIEIFFALSLEDLHKNSAAFRIRLDYIGILE